MQEEITSLFAKTPISALKPSTLQNLSDNLDAERIATQRSGLLRNWKGLVELTGHDNELIMKLENEPYPTKRVLEIWQKEAESTIGKLIEFLTEMGRFDAIDDAWKLFIRDAEEYAKKPKKKLLNEKYEGSALSISSNTTVKSNTSIKSNDSVFYSINCDYLTTSDTTETLAYFDAFVCYTYADKEFVNDLIINVEQGYKLKLCIPDRDMLPGVLELLANVELIKNRCRRMIIVLSPEFLCSQEHSFLTTLVQAISVDDRKRIIVPVIYKQCQLPPTLHALSKLDYTRGDMFRCFWGRLIDSLRLNDEPTRGSSSLSLSSDSPSPSSASITPPTFHSGLIIPYKETNIALPSASSGYSSFSVQHPMESGALSDLSIHNLNQNCRDDSEHEHETEQRTDVLSSTNLSLSTNNNIVINDNPRKNSKGGRSPKFPRFKKTIKKLIRS